MFPGNPICTFTRKNETSVMQYLDMNLLPVVLLCLFCCCLIITGPTLPLGGQKSQPSGRQDREFTLLRLSSLPCL
ncbi:hypothetical protein ATANTOWER_012092, partial [Ataeniobius toweri]|nr:hypothetical protein [Ataeniobius toweri]